ncbi:MAG: hypothetical protein HXS54_16765 [Theionarchaea archaeon]|nr:hypothetical protein [Theionarchaea archaeon]
MERETLIKLIREDLALEGGKESWNYRTDIPQIRSIKGLQFPLSFAIYAELLDELKDLRYGYTILRSHYKKTLEKTRNKCPDHPYESFGISMLMSGLVFEAHSAHHAHYDHWHNASQLHAMEEASSAILEDILTFDGETKLELECKVRDDGEGYLILTAAPRHLVFATNRIGKDVVECISKGMSASEISDYLNQDYKEIEKFFGRLCLYKLARPLLNET